MDERLARVLTNDPGIGVARHADAGYEDRARRPPTSAACACRWRSTRERRDGGADRRDRRLGAGGARPLRASRAGTWPSRIAATRPADLPAGVLAVEADLTDPASAEAVVAAALERFGSVEALANIAGGFAAGGTLDEAPVDVWRSQMAVNLDTAYHMTRAALAPMRAAGRGAIVYIGSSATERPFPGAAGYIVSKIGARRPDAGGRRRGAHRGHPRQHRGREDRRHAAQPGRQPGRRLLPLDDGRRARGASSSGSAPTTPRRSRAG